MKAHRIVALAGALFILAAVSARADNAVQNVPVNLTLGAPGNFGGNAPYGYCALAVSPPLRVRGGYTQNTIEDSTANGPIPILGGQVTIAKVITADQGTWVMTYVPTGTAPNTSAITIRYNVKVAPAKPKQNPSPKPTPTPKKS